MKKINPLSRCCAITLWLVFSACPLFADQSRMKQVGGYPLWNATAPTLHPLAFAAEPDYLDCSEAVSWQKKEEYGGTITPFIGTDQVLPEASLPDRPAIASNDEIPLVRPEVTAGLHVDFGTFKFNLGYTLPATKVDDFVRPLGVEMQPGTDSKRFCLGVKIPF